MATEALGLIDSRLLNNVRAFKATRSALLLCVLWLMSIVALVPGLAGDAIAVEVENRLVSAGLPGDTGAGASTPSALNSADGRYTLFQSSAANLVDGVIDFNSAPDVFLYDRIADVVTLVSRSSSSAATTANDISYPTAISSDGDWVLFYSAATDVVAGVTDSNGVNDVFLYRRSTGAVSLVSRSPSSAMTANNLSVPTAISADGEWVLFQSDATNVVAGVTDSNGTSSDVFLYQRSTGAVTLVSRSTSSATTTANSFSEPTAISADGEWVLFLSGATNLIAGVTDSNGTFDSFLYQRSTGELSLVSRSSSSATTTANSFSEPTAISPDGEWVLFQSAATNVVAEVTDSNGANDVFLYGRSTGAVSLISRSASSATTTANRRSFSVAFSADGEWVLFGSDATNVVAGVTDSNGTFPDAFLYQRSNGAVSLISRSASLATGTANNYSIPITMSPDGEWVLFYSAATDVVAGVADSNGTNDVFLYRRSTGAVSLISRSASSTTTTANGYSDPIAISPNGEWVLFRSDATNVVAGVTDSNGTSADVFLYQTSTGGVILGSRSASSATTTMDADSYSTAISADGEWVLFHSGATSVVAGVTDSNGTQDVFIFQRSTGAVTLVSRSASSAATTANDGSSPTAISADGEWVLFKSAATNVVAGVTDSNSSVDVFLYQRSTGAVSLVSRSASSATTTANNDSIPIAISPDGEWVLFHSGATNVVAGVTDSNGMTSDVFLYQRSTGAVTLVSRSASSATTTANGESTPTAISADGEWVLFWSVATNVIAGMTDSSGTSPDVFLYQRSTGAVTLVSHSASSATTTANGESTPTAISADGEWVLFDSYASNLVAGVTDINGTQDTFLYQRSTGAVTLVSRSVSSATTTANNKSYPIAISADGEWILFFSSATDVVAGVTDSNGTYDSFLYQRSTGAVTLVSSSASSATTTANNSSESTAISADGEWVLFQSDATNVVAGVTDSNSTIDVFLYQRSTGAVSLVSRSASSATTTANNYSYPTAISTNGERVLFYSAATNVVAGVADGNSKLDVFLADVSVPDGTSTAITSAVPEPSAVGQPVSVQVSVSGNNAQPADGGITVTASTGENCSDATPSTGSGTTALFDCPIGFSTVGPRTLTATFSGSLTHADSTSAAEPHTVVTTLTLSPASLPGGTFGASYDQSVAASGAGSTAPYSYSISAGMPPSGLNLNPVTGQLSGITTAAGSFTFEISATDSSAPGVGGPFSGSREYIVDIVRANQAALTAIATPSTINLGAISTQSTTGGSGTGAVTFVVTAGGSFCEVTGTALTGSGVGTCTVTANKAADANYNAASATVDVTVLAATDLEVSKTDETLWAIPNAFVDYEILVANAGPLAVTGARIEDPLPAGLADALWTCSPVQIATCPTPSGSGGIDQMINLPVNGVLRYAFSARVTATLDATITNTVTVTPPIGMLETDAADNIATDVNVVDPNGLFFDGFEATSRRISVPLPP